MTEGQSPFAHLALEEAIALRWALRDIRAKRLKLSPVDPQMLQTLIEMGLVEARDENLELTQAGLDAIS
jgi:Mn-dependent DtxR family transcriptional regulator